MLLHTHTHTHTHTHSSDEDAEAESSMEVDSEEEEEGEKEERPSLQLTSGGFRWDVTPGRVAKEQGSDSEGEEEHVEVGTDTL